MAYKQLQSLVDENTIYIIIGTITHEDEKYYNTAILFSPHKEKVFYDVADYEDMDRYELIKSHIRTRSVENVTYTLAVDTIFPYQTALTVLYDKSGCSMIELKRNQEGMLVYELEKSEPDFGERGRIDISDWLMTIERKSNCM